MRPSQSYDIVLPSAFVPDDRIGEVWVTSTLRDLLAGSGLSFEPRHEIEVDDRRLQLDAAS